MPTNENIRGMVLSFIKRQGRDGATREDILGSVGNQTGWENPTRSLGQMLRGFIQNQEIVEVENRLYDADHAPSSPPQQTVGKKPQLNGSVIDAMVQDDREPARPIQPMDRFAPGQVHFVRSYDAISGVDILIGESTKWFQWYRVPSEDLFVQVFVSLEIPDPMPGMVFTDQATKYRIWYRTHDGKMKKSESSLVPDQHKVILIIQDR